MGDLPLGRSHSWLQSRLSWWPFCTHGPQLTLRPSSSTGHSPVLGSRMRSRAHCRPLPLTPSPCLCCQPLGCCAKEEVGQVASHHAPLTPPRRECQRRHRGNRLPTSLLYRLRRHRLSHAAWPRGSNGQNRYQERLPSLPSPSCRPPSAWYEIARPFLLRQSPSLWPEVSPVHLQLPGRRN